MSSLESEFEFKTIYGEKIGVRQKQKAKKIMPEEIPFDYIKNPVVAEKESKKTKFYNFNPIFIISLILLFGIDFCFYGILKMMRWIELIRRKRI